MMPKKKILFLLLIFLFLNNCVQSTALLGPVITVASTGNIYQAGIQYGTNEAVKKETGKDTVEYISTVLNSEEEKTMNENLKILVEKRIKKTRAIISKKN